jgi:hypothetical protein
MKRSVRGEPEADIAETTGKQWNAIDALWLATRIAQAFAHDAAVNSTALAQLARKPPTCRFHSRA